VTTTPRPLAHYTPPAWWMNDPNGLVFFNDLWHLFYQYQPNSPPGKHWGHAVSRDLIGWEDWPVALWPDELGEIWSGSCVVDWDNSSGFFPDEPGLVAIFTHRLEISHGEKQSQSLAFSHDEGRTWTKSADNPVLESERSDFRDPKVFRHAPTQSWIMIVAAGTEAQIYRSPDLQTWTFASSFGAEQTRGLVWECPDLFSLRDEENREVWVLSSSFLDRRNLGGSFQDCFAAYFAGDFDGFTFSPHANQPQGGRRVSFAPDDYAPVRLCAGFFCPGARWSSCLDRLAQSLGLCRRHGDDRNIFCRRFVGIDVAARSAKRFVATGSHARRTTRFLAAP